MNAQTDQFVAGVDGLQLTNSELDFFCPVCHDENLQVATFHGTQVCGCGKCNGFLVDSESFGVLIASLRASYRGPDDKPIMMNSQELNMTMNCPACYDSMYTHPYHGPGNVVINSCSGCKLNWLDQGEFAKIIRAPGRR
jgi:Zn-finger nucleic acid-binding protein